MTLQEALNMDAKSFHKACRDAEAKTGPLGPINAGTQTFEASIKSFSSFKSTPKSILAIHNTGKACP
jgi:hypothetical protein